MAISAKMYTILKTSYEDEHKPFVANLFFANASSTDTIEKWFRKIINASDVKNVWISQKPNDTNIFYVEYTQDYEAKFYHGYSVQALDLSNSRQFVVSRMTAEEDWKLLTSIAERFINERKGDTKS